MGTYEVRTGFAAMDLPAVTAWLQGTYWARRRSAETICLSMEHSMCFGVFEAESGRQVAFARAITDGVTAYYLCDVVVDPDCRGKGVGGVLLRALVDHPTLRPLRGFLRTRDAQNFYRKFGFIDGGDMLMQTPVSFD